MKYRRILDHLYGVPWAIRENKLQEIVSLVEKRAEGQGMTEEELERFGAEFVFGSESDRSYRVEGSTAFLPLEGTISRRMNLFASFSGGVSTEVFGDEYAELVADSSIETIVLQVDSPGGSIDGTPELAEIIREGSKKKRTIAVVEGQASSAAYWIASAASEMVAAPSALVGSVGVYILHSEFSEADRKRGVKRTYIKAGTRKTDGNPSEPLTPDSAAALQKIVDAAHEQFLGDVAEHRGQDVEHVRSTWGQGEQYPAAEALELGLIDRIGTMDDIHTELEIETPRTSVRRPSATLPGAHGHHENNLHEEKPMKEEKDQALQGSAEPEPEHQDDGLDQEREALAAEAAKIKAQGEELANELEQLKADRAEAARILATSHATRDLDALGNQIAPAILKAGAEEILVALELGQGTVEINGESLDIRKAVIGLLAATPDLGDLGFTDDETAEASETGDGPKGFTKNETLMKRHGITPERLEELQNKYPAN